MSYVDGHDSYIGSVAVHDFRAYGDGGDDHDRNSDHEICGHDNNSDGPIHGDYDNHKSGQIHDCGNDSGARGCENSLCVLRIPF